MVLLMAFALVAGAATAISPCVLPVLPVVLSAGATGGRRRPLGIVTGLTLSFTFATVALVYVIAALGLPDNLLRTVAIVVLLVFGATLLIPPVSARIETWLTRLTASRGGVGRNREGFWSGLVVGASLGLVYAPCAGPILAGVITVSASQPFTAGRLAVALSYGIGSAIVLYLLMLGGRRITAPLARRSGRLQIAMGAIMVFVALAMLGDWDTRFETRIANDVPGFLVDPSKGLEGSAAAKSALTDLRPVNHSAIGAAVAKQEEQQGQPKSKAAKAALPILGAAPDFVGTQQWFNTANDQPLTLAQLRGHVVLLDFWTYSCINCLRTLPYLKAWDARYRKDGLTIVGVHTPEFPFEKVAGNVAAAIKSNGIQYPVVQDNDMDTWNAYGNEFWPAEYLIDARGRVRAAAFGEGEYARRESEIRSLLAEAGTQKLPGDTHVKAISASDRVTTQESYLGAERATRFSNGRIVEGTHDYGSTALPAQDGLAYRGRWDIATQGATAAGGTLDLDFGAKRVYLVLGSPGQTRHVRVLLDGKPIPARSAGADVHDGLVTVDSQRLYELVDLPTVGRHELRIEPDSGVTGYAFTFG
jgi:cytochrome c biogenesis protein CcdA/thiol-disulfide isomerase/thioredoxin